MFTMQLVIEEEEYVYGTKLLSSIPHHNFHLYPTAYFHNLLPFDIQLTVEVANVYLKLCPRVLRMFLFAEWP